MATTYGHTWGRSYKRQRHKMPKHSTAECLQILRLEAGVDQAAVKSAYRAMAKETHPDKGGDPDEFKRIESAYNEFMQIKT